ARPFAVSRYSLSSRAACSAYGRRSRMPWSTSQLRRSVSTLRARPMPRWKSSKRRAPLNAWRRITHTQRSPTTPDERAIAQFSSSSSACFTPLRIPTSLVALENVSERGQAAVDDQRGARDVARGGAGQEHDRRRELVGVTRTPRGEARQLAV